MPDLFGVAISPFELAEWTMATSINPDLCMVFESWSKQRTLVDTINKAKTFGHTALGVTWEPWKPTAVGISGIDQGKLQPEWSNDAIVAGNHDDYIDAMARCFRDSGMTIYLRFAHEMNGTWYPWFQTPESYVAAWKYVRGRLRAKNCWNAKMVWAPNPDIWRSTPADWLQKLMPYWPGPASVDYVGATMIEFGDDRHYPVELFADRFDLARRIFKKPVLAFECNAARERAVPWFEDLATYVGNGTRPLPLLVLSQGASRAAAAGATGDLAWNVIDDIDGRRAVNDLVTALWQP